MPTNIYDIPVIDIGEVFYLDEDVNNLRLNVEWITKLYGIVCDLDLTVYCYDDRARLVEKLDSTYTKSMDGCCTLLSDIDVGSGSNAFTESVKIEIGNIDNHVEAFLLLLNGGPRNFQHVKTVGIQCFQIPGDKAKKSISDAINSKQTKGLFQFKGKARKDLNCVAIGLVFKDGWHNEDSPRWAIKSFLEPISVFSTKEIEDKCFSLVVDAVPILQKFRQRLFNSVRDVCTALSSLALPKLKKKFLKSQSGLPILTFTEVLFKQLYESHPKIIEENEAPSLVAMLHEVFNQIDYNGDSFVDWDEFTSFIIQNSLINNAGTISNSGLSGNGALSVISAKSSNTAVKVQVVNAVSSYSTISTVLKIEHKSQSQLEQVDDDNGDDEDNATMVNSNHIYTSNNYPNSGPGQPSKLMIYDVIYISDKDFYAFSLSDHTINICKEHVSVSASDRNIYGWDIDKPSSRPLFIISRHSDIITDFISVDNLDCFVTCSMDKRIVMWSSISRRVKGIFTGHKRGVRCLSNYDVILLSAGYECEARTWDLSTKEPLGLLKGHRYPIVTAKLMCDLAYSEKDYRAITVDEKGEFRLWNIYIKERSSSSDHISLPTLQIFEMSHRESPLDNIRFLAIPYNKKYTAGYYSDIIACSTKLLRFLPEKNAKEFLPPSSSLFNEATATIYTAIGKTLLKYDTGLEVDAFLLDVETELTGIVNYTDDSNRNFIYTCSMDGRIRSIEEHNGILSIHNTIENAFGDEKGITSLKLITSLGLLIATSSSKAWGIWNETTFKKIIILHESDLVLGLEVLGSSRDSDESSSTHSAEITAQINKNSKKESLVTLVVALCDRMHIYTIDVVDIRGLVTCRLLYSIKSQNTSFLTSPRNYDNDNDYNANTKIINFEEHAPIRKSTPNTASLIDVSDGKKQYFTDIKLMNFPKSNESVNNSKQMTAKNRCQGTQLVACTDDGIIFIWNINDIRWKSEALYRKTYENVPVVKPDTYFLREPSPPSSPLHSPKPKTFKVKSPLPSSNKRNVTYFPFQQSELPSTRSSALSPINNSENDQNNEFLDSSDHTVKNDKSRKYLRSSMLTIIDKNFNIVSPTHHAIENSSLTSNNTLDSENEESTEFNLTDNGNDNNEIQIQVETNNVKTVSEYNVTLFHVLPHNAILPDIFPSHAFIGHCDSISNIVSMTEHGCFLSVSLDGYHRIWNADQQCLGELALPNLTERMKVKPSNLPFVRSYKFVLEKISISKAHKDMSILLVSNILSKNQSYLQSSSPLQDFHKADNDNNANYSNKKTNKKTGSISVVSTDRRYARVGDTKDLKLLISDSLNKQGNEIDFNKNNNDNSAIRINLLNSLRENSSDNSNDNHELLLDPPSPNLFSPYKYDSETQSFFKTATKIKEKNNENDIKSLTFSNSTPINNDNSSNKMMSPKFRTSSNQILSPISSSKKHSKIESKDQDQSIKSKSINTSSNSLWMNLQESLQGKSSAPQAFSDASLIMGMNERVLDGEGFHILKSMNLSNDKLLAFDRQPTVLLRNPGLSVSFEMPSIDEIHRSEVEFGSQKDMYKNAKDLLEKSNKLSKSQMRSAIALRRVESSANKIKTMVHVMPPLSHLDIIIPSDHEKKTDDDDASINSLTSEYKSRMRLLQSHSLVSKEAESKARPLDTEYIEKQMRRVELCLNDGFDDDGSNNRKHVLLRNKRHKLIDKDRLLISKATQEIIEKKLALAMKDGYKVNGYLNDTSVAPTRLNSANPFGLPDLSPLRPISTRSKLKKPKLTTRYLLPHYKLDDVKKFMEIFSNVDEDYSGDLDSSEWVKLFSSLNKNVSPQDARMIFMKIDNNNDGSISLRELIPVVFSKADELESLFEAYDFENIGFISIGYIKERIRQLQLPDKILHLFMDSIYDINTDEMVNLIEFKRMFQLFVKSDKT
eukprot:gene18163-23821_t